MLGCWESLPAGEAPRKAMLYTTRGQVARDKASGTPTPPPPRTARSSTQLFCKIKSSGNQGLTNTHARCLLDPGPSGHGYESQAQGLGAGEPETWLDAGSAVYRLCGVSMSANLSKPPVLIYEIGENDCAPFMSPGTENIREGLTQYQAPGTYPINAILIPIMVL